MAQLSQAPKFTVTYVNSSGYVVPAVGYKLYTYTAGTSTPKNTYTDYTLGSANTNPVVMNADGQCNLWLSGNYKLVLKTDTDATVWTVDEVRDLTSSQTLTNMTLAGTLTISSTAVTWSGNPTHSGNHTWTGNQVFNGNVTIGDSGADTLTVTPNAITWSNNPTHSGTHTFSSPILINAINGSTSGALKISATGVPYGTSVHNNAGAVTGTTNQYFCSGTYVPTFTLTTNVAAVAASGTVSFRWMRVGNVATVSGIIPALDPTAGSAVTQLGISLPPLGSTVSANSIAGTGVRSAVGTTAQCISGTIFEDVGNTRATLYFYCDADAAARDWYVHFTMTIT